MASSPTRLPHTRHAGRGHLRALDGLRGLAILMVLGSHLFESNYRAQGLLVRFTGRFFFYGLFGVDLFFVLSGFLITGILVDSLSDPHFFRKFYARRVLRIFPLYYGVLIALLLLTPGLPWHNTGWILAAYLQNYFPASVQSHAPSPHFGLFHLWSLAIEEQFYLVWPAVVFLVRGSRRLLYTALGVSVFALLLRLILLSQNVFSLTIHQNTLCRADTLLIGAALAILYRSRHWDRILRVAPATFWIALAVFASVTITLPANAELLETGAIRFWLRGIRYDVVALGFAGLLAWTLDHRSRVSRFFERKSLCFFGKYSYGIYILHGVMLPFLVSPLRAFIDARTGNKLLGVLLSGLICMAISVLAAVLSYQLYEKHFLRLKRFFDYAPIPSSSQETPVERTVAVQH